MGSVTAATTSAGTGVSMYLMTAGSPCSAVSQPRSASVNGLSSIRSVIAVRGTVLIGPSAAGRTQLTFLAA
jgi:hypothetical protein